jgi:branched-chain amino acid transport system ATP-binding protein
VVGDFMTVYENLEMGAYTQSNRRKVRENIERLMEYFPIFRERQKQMGRTLSGGEQQMLAMARGLMSQPKLMLLDEPSLGLSPIFVKKVFEIINDLNKEGTTILLIEQNARLALQIAHYGYILETGKVTLAGESKQLLNQDSVRELYLGG